MTPGRYIQRITGGWAVVEVLPARKVEQREPRRERLIDSFTGPGAKARAIREAGTNAVLDPQRARFERHGASQCPPVDLSGVQAATS